MGLMDRILRTGEGRKLRALAELVPDINALEPEIQALSDDALQAKTPEFRSRLEKGEDLDDLLLEAFAVMREAARRVIGQRHFDVQLMGGAALHFGWVAEMKTGEGKTLVSTLPVYLNGLSGDGVHVVTVNDYLASRDAAWMGQIHRWLGISVGLVVEKGGQPDPPAERRAQYACDVTYGTNNAFGFDYLRDNMVLSANDKVQRGHTYAIVDEIDSILIDEARTPLIISGRVADAAQLYYQFARIVRTLDRDVDYEVDEEKRNVAPLDAGVEKVEAALGIENLYDEVAQNFVHQFIAALKAKELYKKDRDYLVADGEVKIVDEFTGRVLEGRRWSDGLHQAVEAKEGVHIKEENQTLATITLQNYFRMYGKLSGMTGTATTEAAEFANTYNLQAVPIPTNRDVVRNDENDLIYKSEEAKFEAVVDDLAERHDSGQPVLVGTISVEKSERLSRLLDKRGIPHNVLNAKQHFREADIVAQAGRLHAITVATNMAGRGVDIILGGNPEGLARRDLAAEGVDLETDEGRAQFNELVKHYEEETVDEGAKVRDLGGLYVLGTERHESRRIDNQLRGRSGRQGDPGESRFYLSLEDDLMRLFATGAISWVMNKALPDDVPIEAKMVTKAMEKAQNTVEQRNAEIRKNVLKYDEVMNEQRKVIYRRRDQILAGTDLREEVLEHLAEVVDSIIGTFCDGEYSEEWDLAGLAAETTLFWPLSLDRDELATNLSTDALYEALMTDATAHYEGREAEVTAPIMREAERYIMLRLIDQRWREHLAEMDYLQEGINLRAMGQRDPLVEWQREGYEMFETMIKAIDRDLVRYVMHVRANVVDDSATGQATGGEATPPADGEGDEGDAPRASAGKSNGKASGRGAKRPAGATKRGVPRAARREPAVQNVRYSAAEDPVQGAGGMRAAAAASPAASQAQQGGGGGQGGAADAESTPNTPFRKDEWAKTSRNEPCPCGSGKKYKLCHGAANK